MVADDQIKQIVQAVLAQLTAQNTSASSQAATSTATVAIGQNCGINAPETAVRSCREAADSKKEALALRNPGEVDLGDTGDMEDIEDLSQINLMQEILVPQPNDRAALEFFKGTTPARIGVWRSGPRPLTRTVLRFRADHAVAQDAVFSELDQSLAEKFDLLLVQSVVTGKDQYLTRPDLGKKLSPGDVEKIRQNCPTGADVQIIVADGLSSRALQANLPHILPALQQGLKAEGLSTGKGILVRYGRVEIMDEIGILVQGKVVVLLVGERPGLGTSESMSAYIVYQPHQGTLIADHTVVSNIHKGGTPPAEAGAHLSGLIKKIYEARVSGVKLSL